MLARGWFSRGAPGLATLVLVSACGPGRGCGDPLSGPGATGPSAAATDSGSPGAAASSASASAAVSASAGDSPSSPEAGFHCFSWVHGAQFSTDCYPSFAECEKERLGMSGGARPTTPRCEKAAHVSCVRLSMPPDTTEKERCFEDAAACGRYRAFVLKSGHRVTACEDR